MENQITATKIDIKPVSVNEAYHGRHKQTDVLKKFKEDLPFLLPKANITEKQLEVSYVFGLSSKNADGDNYIKAFQDIISTCYGFNDRIIFKWSVEKIIVPKGEEFVVFSINKYKRVYYG